MKSTNYKSVLFFLLCLFGYASSYAQTTIPVGASSTYTTIQNAYSLGIPSSITGAYVIELQSDYDPTGETYPISLAAKSGTSATNTITITPAAGVSKTISSSAAQTINLSGATYVIIDGSNNQLTIENTSTGAASTILLNNDASNNIIRYCTIKGESASVGNGTIGITTGSSTGNDNNLIEACNITAYSTFAASHIYINGSSATASNDNNTIYKCNISDFGLTTSSGTKGGAVYVDANTSGTRVRYNNIFLTKQLTMNYGVAFSFVTIAGANSEVLGNVIGYGAADGTGTSTITQSGTTSLTLAAITPRVTTSSTTISENVIGGMNVSCMYFSGVSAQASLSSISINNNIIKDITCTTSSSTLALSGIYYQNNTTTTINGNVIYNLTNVNSADGSAALAKGIFLATASTSACTITGNTIYNLVSGKSSSTAANQTIGIDLSKNTSLVEKNQVYNLNSINNTNTAIVAGIRTVGGSDAGLTVKNNMIRLGLDANNANIYGIYKSAATASTNKYYFYNNSVAIVSPSSGTYATNSYAFYSTGTAGATIENVNNIFSNQRAVVGTEKHYAVGLATASDFTASNYDLYQFNGAFGVIGSTNYTDLSGWQGALSKDANSLVGDPLFVGSTSATADLHLSDGSAAEAVGTDIASVTDDFDGQTRSSLTPTDIGADAGNYANTSGIGNSTASEKNVFGLKGSIRVTNANNQTAHIYNTLGQLVKNVKLTSDDVVVSLPAGIYTLSVNNEKAKVLVK